MTARKLTDADVALSRSAPQGRALSRTETHDLAMVLKERAKLFRTYVEQQAAERMADFEKKLAAEFSFDDDEIWKAATERAQRVVREAQETVAKRCEELGIPKKFAPQIGLSWISRGENALKERRAELRQVAKRTIEAMAKAAITKIEHQALDLRTQVVSMGLLSPGAQLFLDSLAPVTDMMRALEFGEVEAALESDKRKRIENQKRYGGYGQ